MRSSTFTIAMLLSFAINAWSQDSLLLQTLQEHRHDVHLNDGTLRGAGADLLQTEAKSGQFMLIGEDHGLAELPQFTAALYHHLTPVGYHYFATETGPFTASLLQEMAQRPGFMNDLRDTLTKYPWSIPFYNMSEEAEMLQSIMQDRRPEEAVIWGLDQEFIGASRLLLPRLQDQAANAAGQKTIRDYSDRARSGFLKTMAEKNPASIFFYSATPDDFTIIRNSLNDDPAARRLIDELEESWEIYHLFFQREGYASNRQRAEMMKRHFLEYYRAAKMKEEHPKVLFKFGANHMYRGANGLNVFDIGNFINELASQEATASFHLYVVGKGGTQNAFTPFADESARQKPYDAKNYLDRIDLTPVLDLSPDGHWSLFDLRPLRQLLFSKQIRDLDPALEKVIWSYDALLVIPEVHASGNVVTR
ncbi:hypothetical protein [Flavilitoribacter nigricans]|uniref:Erythromycin esterase family protein n=1 Tax=Flavilitoribacter nigricans (strain ATCC 23147 / DSM 23189 / NBRC 102662 / NCIMB 1420 / SS-2) TaxID=1122177 RepID=A0A2D0NBE9_FLAN2|nr:hypothetical protein [Flavilitoribacter nigricans]PHN05093.1 hypothetical protein CRP01_18905 [Flavilitoribacter nigricans DSM 23189 = NBRC 102662]